MAKMDLVSSEPLPSEPQFETEKILSLNIIRHHKPCLHKRRSYDLSFVKRTYGQKNFPKQSVNLIKIWKWAFLLAVFTSKFGHRFSGFSKIFHGIQRVALFEIIIITFLPSSLSSF